MNSTFFYPNRIVALFICVILFNTSLITKAQLNIISNGFVGVGTTTPSFPVSLGTGLGNKIALWDAGSGVGYGLGIQSNLLQIFANAATDRVGIGYGNSGSFTETLTIKGAKVGIGNNNPSIKLDILNSAGGTLFRAGMGGSYPSLDIYQNSSGPARTSFLFSNGAFEIYDQTSAASRFFIAATSGNVGVGTASPGQKLDVAGNINLSSSANAFMINGSKILWNNGNVYDIFVGTAGNSTMTGHANTFMGMGTGSSNTTGAYNCAFGNCLGTNSTGASNCAMGYIALNNNSSGSSNTAIGVTALTFNQIGKYNTAIGADAIRNNYSGSSNTAGGNYALYNNSGSWNTAFGDSALRTNTTGTYNTAIGYNANVSVNNLTNITAIGYNASVGASNTIVLGNSSITALKCNVQTITALSDGRVKNNIRENVPGLEFIRLLRPVTYHLDVDKQNQIRGVDDKNNSADKYEVEKVQFDGFIAQEVEEASRKVGYNFSGLYKPKNNKDLYGLGYTTFVVPMVKAIQELDVKNNKLEIEIKQLYEIIQAQLTQQANAGKEIAELKKIVRSMASITQASIK